MPALDGMRILDLTQYEAGPSCTQALAWFGADVVKIESPGDGDPGRSVGIAQGFADESSRGYTQYFCHLNANKRSVALSLTSGEGHDLFMRLLPRFDVVVENFGPGVVERLNVGYEKLKQAHPSLIYAQLKGFGTSGPYAHFKSYDMIAQAAAGAFSVTGEPDGEPMIPGPTTGDTGTGVQLALSIVAAYVQRLRTGEGQLIEISMQEAMTYYMRTRISMSNWGTKPTERAGHAGGLAPVDLFPCKPFGPNDWVYVQPITNRQLDQLFMAIERPEILIDERFHTPEARRENGAALCQEVASWTRDRTKYEAMKILGDAGVPCSAVIDTAEIHRDPHLVERGFVNHIDHPGHGVVPLLGFAPRLSDSKVELERAPLLGEHTDDILTLELNLKADELAALHQSGVVG